MVFRESRKLGDAVRAESYLFKICLTPSSVATDNPFQAYPDEAPDVRGDRMNVKLMIVTIVIGLTRTAAAAPPVDYGREIKPILAARCTACHGAIRQKAGLRLDTARFVRRGGENGPAVEPGKSGESLLIDRVTGADGSDRMPPKSEGVALSEGEIAVLRAWIDQGAEAPPEPTPPDPRKHWAYQPPVRPRVPQPADADWARNPIDAFLAAGYESRGLRPSASGCKDLWLRRVYLDLIGLPPTRDERQALPRRRLAECRRDESSTACSPTRATASAGGDTGWTSGGIATGTGWARRFVTATLTSGDGVTGLSRRSTPTRATTG